jgi:hypothetical protein
MDTEDIQKRYLFRIYNIPREEYKLATLLHHLTISYKKIWMASPTDDMEITWAWIEFYTLEELEMAKQYLDGMKWHSQTVVVSG